MAVQWHIKQVLAAKGIKTAIQLQSLLEDRLGLQVSRQSLAKLLKRQPQSLRLETAQLLCTLLQLPLNELLTVTPEPLIKAPGAPIKPYVRQKKKPASVMVDPGAFF
jgi:putative transcriptional regulator